MASHTFTTFRRSPEQAAPQLWFCHSKTRFTKHISAAALRITRWKVYHKYRSRYKNCDEFLFG